VRDSQMALADHNVFFEPQAGSAAVQKAKGALSLPAAGRYLNAPRVQIGLLAKHRFIEPFLAAKDFGAVDQFAVADLDDFLKRLFAGARPVRTPEAGQVDIPSAAGRCCCSSMEILGFILAGKLAWVGRQDGLEGYMSVLVDINEVRPMVRGAELGGLGGQALAERMHVADRVTRNLIAGGHLRTVTVINPVNRCPTVIVPNEEIERFQREFVSLFALAKQQGRHFRKLKLELEGAGMKPAFNPETVGATFYRIVYLPKTGTRLA
jgi:hypothetical protein